MKNGILLELKSLTLMEDDSKMIRTIEFCDEMMRRYDNDNIFFDHIIFPDETSFQLNGMINRQLPILE